MTTYDEALAAVNEARAHQATTAAAVNAAYETLRKAKYEGQGDIAAAQTVLDAAVAADNIAAATLRKAAAVLRKAVIADAPGRPATCLSQMFDRPEDGPTGLGW
jgi:hypothetical protein